MAKTLDATKNTKDTEDTEDTNDKSNNNSPYSLLGEQTKKCIKVNSIWISIIWLILSATAFAIAWVKNNGPKVGPILAAIFFPYLYLMIQFVKFISKDFCKEYKINRIGLVWLGDHDELGSSVPLTYASSTTAAPLVGRATLP